MKNLPPIPLQKGEKDNARIQRFHETTSRRRTTGVPGVQAGAPEEAERRAAAIPDEVDVLITHGPSTLFGAESPIPLVDGSRAVINLGDPFLLGAITRVRPSLHIFGHVHDGYGVYSDGYTEYHNVAVCDAQYEPVNIPHVINLETK